MKSKINKRELLLESLSVFALKAFGLVLMFIISIMLARLLGSKSIGNLYLAQSIINIAIVIGMFGLGNLVIKLSAQNYTESNWHHLENLQKSVNLIIVVFASIITFFILVSSDFLGSIFYKNQEVIPILKWLCLTIMPINILTVFISIHKGIQKTAIAIIIESIGIPLIVLCLILLNLEGLTLIKTVKFYVLASLVVLFVTTLHWKTLQFRRKSEIKKAISKKELITSSLPMYGITLTNLVISVTDIIMLGFWESSEIVGQYGVALRISSISSIVLIVINTVVASKFAIFHKNSDIESLSELAKNSTKIMIVIATVFLSILLFSGDFLLGIFGEEFVLAKNILVILAIGQFVVLSTGPVAMLLMMTGHEKFHQYTTIFSALINIILNLILIPIYGGLGAAIATMISLVFKNVVAISYINLYLNIRTLPWNKYFTT